jgi:hypothetical protein
MHDGVERLNGLVQWRRRVVHVDLGEIDIVGAQPPERGVDRVEQVFA